jgi:hypothetical protein
MSHLKILLRNIFIQKGYSLINVSGLAIGIAVCSLIFLWVYDELSYDKYHENLENIHQVVINVDGQWWSGCNWALAPIIKRDYPEVQKAARCAFRNVLLKYQDNSFYESGAEWAKRNLDQSWTDLIDRAWGGRPNPAHSVRQPADKVDFKRTLEFVRVVMRAANDFAAERSLLTGGSD